MLLRIFLRSALLGGLCLIAFNVGAAAPVVWVALSEAGGVYAETARTLQADPRSADWIIAPWSELEQRTPAPALLVTIGAKAWADASARFSDAATAPATLAVLLPRTAFERHQPRGARPGRVSAVLLDQPLARQARLLKLALPGIKNVGVLLGTESKMLKKEVEVALEKQDLTAEIAECLNCDLYPTLQSLLDRSEIILAIPDPTIYNNQTITGILIASYRQRVPLIGFSPSYVKAGALLAIFSTPRQQGVTALRFVDDFLARGSLPSPQTSDDFTLQINPDIARAFGLSLDEKALDAALRKSLR